MEEQTGASVLSDEIICNFFFYVPLLESSGYSVVAIHIFKNRPTQSPIRTKYSPADKLSIFIR